PARTPSRGPCRAPSQACPPALIHGEAGESVDGRRREDVSRPASGTPRGRARLPRSRASQAGFGEGQVMLGLPPCLEDAGRDFAPLELLAQLQPKEPAGGGGGGL